MRGADPAQLLRGLVGVVLDRLRLVEHEARPVDLGDGVDVAHRGAVGGDDDVGALDLVGDLVVRGAAGAVVHEHAQPGREARRLGRPVADDRGRRDDQRGTAVGRASRWASMVGVLPRPMSRARQPPMPPASRNPSQASASAW